MGSCISGLVDLIFKCFFGNTNEDSNDQQSYEPSNCNRCLWHLHHVFCHWECCYCCCCIHGCRRTRRISNTNENNTPSITNDANTQDINQQMVVATNNTNTNSNANNETKTKAKPCTCETLDTQNISETIPKNDVMYATFICWYYKI